MTNEFENQDFPSQEIPTDPTQDTVTPSSEPQSSEYRYVPPREAKQFYDGPVKQKKKFSAGKIIALALCFSLLGSILGVAGTVGVYWVVKEDSKNILVDNTKDDSTILIGDWENTVINAETVDTSKVMTPAEVYATNVNATVGIATSVTTNYWGYQTTSAASGSGFILSNDGYIVTNYHVVEDSTSISVALYDGTTYDAKIVGYDANNDIAVLKVEAENLTPVIIGDSENMNVGDTVLAIGNPLGELTFSLTHGVISAMNRQVTLSSGSTMNLIQTDCSINSGNSGGALFNLYGEVVGITNAKYSNNGDTSEASIENIGFAIPISQVISIIESIIEKGYIAKPYIGVSVMDVSQETQSYGLPEGAAVKDVTADSPSEKAGLKVNDIITKVNDTDISGSQDLVSIVGKAVPGDVLVLSVYRQGKTLEITITVGEQIQSAIPEGTTAQESNSQIMTPWSNFGH